MSRIVFCTHYAGTATEKPCKLGLLKLNKEEPQILLHGRARGVGCILEYKNNVQKIQADGTCTKKQYPKMIQNRLVSLYYLLRGRNGKETKTAYLSPIS